MQKLTFILEAVAVLTTLASCSTLTTNQYEATALTTYTWQVEYAEDLANNKLPRFETFATTSLLNTNGTKPEAAVTGPDDQGLWWPALPPRPSVDEVEQRKQPQEEASKPELLKSVQYRMKYAVGDQQRTLPTNYQVYRQVVKAIKSHTPLQLTLGVSDNSVEKAEPSGN
jgi:hypothetical protein